MPKRVSLKSKTESLADGIKSTNKINITPKKSTIIKRANLIPTGSTLLNCACSDNPFGGYGKGKVVNIIGDSGAAKTTLALSMLAEICKEKRLNEYGLYLDDAEEALEHDIIKLFGSKAGSRINIGKGSETVEEFYGNFFDKLETGDPFIYVLDSFDAVSSVEEQKRAEEEAKIYRGEKTKRSGSFKTEKARMASELFRVCSGAIKETNSLLAIISQTRSNIGFGAQFTPKIRSGGKALKFYSTHEMWLAIRGKIKASDLEIGQRIECRLTKNKLTGKKRVISFPVYDFYGVDDITSCINFLITEERWKGSFLKDGRIKKVHAIDFGVEGNGQTVIKAIESGNLENDLKKIVGEVWMEKEEEAIPERKPRF